MSKFLDWYRDNFQIDIPDRENRLACMSESQGAFYRKKEPLKFDIFKPKMKTTDNYYIERVIVREKNLFRIGFNFLEILRRKWLRNWLAGNLSKRN